MAVRCRGDSTAPRQTARRRDIPHRISNHIDDNASGRKTLDGIEKNVGALGRLQSAGEADAQRLRLGPPHALERSGGDPLITSDEASGRQSKRANASARVADGARNRATSATASLHVIETRERGCPRPFGGCRGFPGARC